MTNTNSRISWGDLSFEFDAITGLLKASHGANLTPSQHLLNALRTENMRIDIADPDIHYGDDLDYSGNVPWKAWLAILEVDGECSIHVWDRENRKIDSIVSIIPGNKFDDLVDFSTGGFVDRWFEENSS